ncbi:hypothetical protein H6G89_03775 [Oscillatoria sp. FACHB-1407]|uniref:hypothetical protein n=1 Tax=Oscillatoria sp. FACHB-1407 TaxID=2692847 RepID=UPI0019C2F185|nr:hypothetical protein [Oscillatoria sp. FACHB-1407]
MKKEKRKKNDQSFLILAYPPSSLFLLGIEIKLDDILYGRGIWVEISAEVARLFAKCHAPNNNLAILSDSRSLAFFLLFPSSFFPLPS